MAGTRTAQDYFNSGEISQIKINGIEQSNNVVIHDDISTVTTTPSYCCYENVAEVTLTNAYQKVNGWSPYFTSDNITYSNGVFTTNTDGLFEWHLERRYVNYDINPSEPITIMIEVRKNGIAIYNRETFIGAATAHDEPSIVAFCSPFIFEVTSGDYFDFYVKAQENGNSPIDTRLTIMQMTAHKIHNS